MYSEEDEKTKLCLTSVGYPCDQLTQNTYFVTIFSGPKVKTF